MPCTIGSSAEISGPNGPIRKLLLAERADREAIFLALLREFDKYADHIIPLEELEQLIEQDQVIISRDPRGGIKGFVIFRLMHQTCNFNFLYNGGSPMDLAYLLGNFYGVLTKREVRSGFGWVRRTRPLVLKLHQSFGWNTDGLMDHIYLR